MSCQFEQMHRSDVQRPMESKLCEGCPKRFMRFCGSDWRYCKGCAWKRPRKLKQAVNLSKHWTDMTTFYLRTVQ